MDDNSSELNTELNTEELVAVSKEEEAHLALKELSDYVADSFMTTGYDTLQVSSRMDTSGVARKFFLPRQSLYIDVIERVCL